MAVAKVRLTIQDVTWERCVSRVENILKSLRGVLDVKARLAAKNLGDAEILYDPIEITSEEIKRAVPKAGGEKHKFAVIAMVDWR